MIFKKLLILSALIPSSVFAGFNGLTFHSRANCLNNESISWDATKKWVLHTTSDHDNSYYGSMHLKEHQAEETRRSAAVCWKEGVGQYHDYIVTGNHWYIDPANPKISIKLGTTKATDCSKYDGWWDWDNENINREDKNMKKVAALLLITPMISNALAKELDNRNNELVNKGYYETESDYAQFLLKRPSTAQDEIRQFNTENSSIDTHLKGSYIEIPLAFNPHDMSWLNGFNVIGYAAVGTNTQSGWSGLKSFFTDEILGSCSYTYLDLKASEGQVFGAKSNENSSSVEGNQNGYLYTLSWYKNYEVNTLECAKLNYDRTIPHKMKRLGDKIG